MPCCFTTPDYNHADALRAVTESPEVMVKYYNEASVLMQASGGHSMKRYTCLTLTLAMIVSAVALSLSGVSAQHNADQDSQDPSRSQVPQRIAVQQNAGQDALPDDLALAKTISYVHLAEHIGRHGIADVNELRTVRVMKDEQSLTHTHVQQTYRGVPVFGGEAIVHLNADSSLSDITDNLISYVQVETEPTITAKEATQIGVSKYGCGECLTATPEVDLWVLRRNGRDRLVYRVQMRREDGSAGTAMPVYFIDAHTGSKVWSYDNLQSSGAVTGTGNSLYSGTRSITTYYKSISPYIGYYMEDITRKVGTYNNQNTDNTTYLFIDADNVWNGSYQAIAVDAHYGAEKFIDYLKIKHGRSGLDGSGGPGWYTSTDDSTTLISLKVHVGVNLNKGYWNGQYVSFGDGDGTVYGPTATLDMVGHEMQHGVTQFTANLINSGESGALSESWSDVFGAMLERYVKGESADTWKIFEQCWTPQTAGDAERYMDTPHSASNKGLTADDDPDHYDERYLGTADNGGVHVNSGIPNKVFYLVAKGGTHHRGGSMTGIGADAAEKIWYKALASYMTSNTNFKGARTATLNAAAALYGLGSTQYNAVGQAWTLCGVLDDSSSVPSLSVNNITTTESNTGETAATFTVKLTPASTQAVTVKYQTANSTALAPGDYTALPLTLLTFDAGQTTKTVTVKVKGDTLDEANETFRLLLSAPTHALISDNEGICTINDNDAPPSVRVNSVAVTEGNSAVAANFTVSLSAPSAKTITVKYQTMNGTATAPRDYSARALTTLTFSPFQTTKTVGVTVAGDLLNEPAETFKLVLSSPTNATVAVAAGVCTITDNDPAPSITVTNATVTEPDTGTVNAVFTVRLSAASGQNVTVKYVTANGTTNPATAGTDYTAIALTTLTFLPGQTSKTVAVPVRGDLVREANETFFVNLSAATNATISDAQGHRWSCSITLFRYFTRRSLQSCGTMRSACAVLNASG